jgi:PAS domain S-box-containing protein
MIPDGFFEGACAGAADAVVVIDHENRIRFCNAAAERMFGLAGGAALGRNVAMLVPSGLRAHHDCLVSRHRESRESRLVGGCRIVPFERADGAAGWANISLSAVETADGLWYLAVIRDVTAARMREVLTEQSLEQAADAVVVIDHTNAIRLFNAAAERLFLHPRAEAIGRNVKMLVPPEIRDMHDAMIAANRVTGHDKIIGSAREVEMIRADGRRFTGSLSLSRIRIGDATLYAAFIHDVSEQVEARRAQLELAALRERFAAFLSHELRTPLAVIDAAARKLDRKTAAGDMVAARGAVDTMRAASARMRRLADQALATFRMLDGGLQPQAETVSLRGFLDALCDERREIAPSHRLTLEIAPNVPEIIVADPTLLHSALDNLLSNAVKYSPDAEAVEVRAAVEDGRLRIAVTDFGRGVPEDEQAAIFRRFYRASTAAGLPGTGVGLDLVAAIAAAHGGEATVRSVVGQGSTFTLVLPLADGASRGAALAPARPFPKGAAPPPAKPRSKPVPSV